MSKIYAFNPAHLFKAQGIPWEPDVLAGIIARVNDPDWSILSCFSSRKLEAVFACKRIHGLVAECVALPCGGFSPIALHKGALVAIGHWTEKLQYRRLQATVKVGYKKGEDWLVSLGFMREGLLRGYDPRTREDHVLYGRVF